jgi:hypothetical protein
MWIYVIVTSLPVSRVGKLSPGSGSTCEVEVGWGSFSDGVDVVSVSSLVMVSSGIALVGEV